MGFRRSPEEVAAVQATLADVEFVGGESLSVDFLTRPETIRDILPAELDPGAEPRITVQVSRWRSNCVGDFAASAVYVSASHDGVAGDYVLTMFMDNDVPMLFGRDLYGEPKKIGTSTLWRNDGHMTGVLERRGTPLVRIEADLGPDRGPTEVVGRNFNVKYALEPGAQALAGPPTLMMAEFAQRTTVVRKGPATLELGGTVHDPLDSLEVVELRDAVYVETGMKATCVPLGPMDADAFLPLALGRSDHWPALSTARLPV
ncbi:acetoacetate decarboxylase family protein [Nocardioides abyssi]|uniref:Acetoacetate decarboxylase family protein n=1 Tax=Nocardioides abyssi TaxID=3058370 RepID=A0ABT8EQB5_9ACTN|nr:acetoacetate decarboxylase family protein [Nocardioides abyssi]MDN4160203.1 acetoacetate decarboxylase family protein [Nocardioides abyssi]